MEGDSLKALPTSRVAEALRRYQEQAALAVGAADRPPFMRAVASVAEALIGQAPEGLDDIASGMARLKRPAQHESWVSANQPMLDALGLAPVSAPGSGATKAVLMGGKMLRAVGRGREFREASEHLLDTGDAPLGWIKHPGTPRTHVGSLMKYEPMPLKVDVARTEIFDGNIRPGQSRPAEHYFEPNEFLDAYENSTGGRLRIVPQSDTKALGSYRRGPHELHVGQRTAIRAAQDDAASSLFLRDLFGHELTHAGQSASLLLPMQRGGNVSMWNPTNVNRIPTKVPLDLAGDPDTAVMEIARRRLEAMGQRGEPFNLYEQNPGETIARTMGGLASKEGLAGGWTPARRNYELQQALIQANQSSRVNPSVYDIVEEARILLKQLNQRRSASPTAPAKGTP